MAKRIALIKLCVLACTLSLSLNPAAAQDPDLSGTIEEFDPDTNSESSMGGQAFLGTIPGTDESCESIGAFNSTFQFPNRYRGNLYRLSIPGLAIREIKMALAFAGTADLYVSVHRMQLDGTFVQVDINPDPGLDYLLIDNAVGAGDANAQYFSTGLLGGAGGVPLPPGDYAIGFAWGTESVRYGRDTGFAYPQSFPAGLILASVSRELGAGEPPIPGNLASLTQFTGGVYAMELCFDPALPDPCPAPPGPCFGPGERDPQTGDCVYPQLTEGTPCSPDPMDAGCSFYTCDANAACLRQCDENCFPFGGFVTTFTFPNRYRGNLFQVSDAGVALREIGMGLAFDGATDLFVSVHRREPDDSYTQIDINDDPLRDYVLIENAQGAGINNPQFYSTGAIGGVGGVPLPPGDYAIGFAWGNSSVRYGRDTGVSYPQAFEFGSILASVSRELSASEPPVPATLVTLATFTGGSYAMELCFEKDQVAVPSVSEWGLAILALTGLIAGAMLFDPRREPQATAPISRSRR